ncbi:MAG: dihydrofolate reductase family protein [Bacteroidota bacterium]
MSDSKVTIHMVASLDGFIAKHDGSVDWMHSKDTYPPGLEMSEEYINEYLAGIHCYMMGSKTYDHAMKLGWPYGDKPVVVLTSRRLVSDQKSVSFYSGDLPELVTNLRSKYQNIWMVGGTNLTKAFLQQGLADEIVYTIVPVILGDGLLFFDYIGREVPLHLKDVTTFKDGMVELTYDIT